MCHGACMSETAIEGKWQPKVEVHYESGKLVRYKVAFYRRHKGGSYDEIRHDSHELKKGRRILAPHFHMKLRCGFKDSAERAVEEIRNIVDNQLSAIGEVIR